MTEPSKDNIIRIQPKMWMGLVAILLYILLAAGLGNILNIIFPTGSELGDFALSHFVPLPILIVGGLLFIRRAGWTREVWTTIPARKQQPKRMWLYAFPILLLIQGLIPLGFAQWNNSSLLLFVTVLIGTAMVGIGEELYVRGILRFTIKARHGAFLTLLITSVVFGLAHTVSAVFNGFEPAFILFEVSALAFTGACYYGVFLATGRLWVVMIIHFVTDFGLYLAGGFDGASDLPLGAPSAVTGMLLGVFVVALIVSTIRQDISAGHNKVASL